MRQGEDRTWRTAGSVARTGAGARWFCPCWFCSPAVHRRRATPWCSHPWAEHPTTSWVAATSPLPRSTSSSEIVSTSQTRIATPFCYVNGFQTQPGERELWPDDALLQAGSDFVTDPDWPDETLLDTSSASSRKQILEIISPWIIGCADAGFDAVEFDNLDTYSRSSGALSREDNVVLATEYVRVAHSAGLAAAQKNSAEDAALLHERAGFDFAVAEECAAYSECERYSQVYGSGVIDIEYDDSLARTFSEVCTDTDTPRSIVLRDRQLSQPDNAAYVFSTCD